MLIGSYNHTIDNKGRLFIPAKWRDDLGVSFIVTRGFGKCLFGMALAEWEKLTAKLAELPMTDANAQMFARYMSSWATDCELDRQGRILVPAKLRNFAGLEKDAVLVGLNSRIEIWNAGEWNKMDEMLDSEYDSMMAAMAQLGI